MSGFSAEWLALREPVDHLSRAAALRDSVAAHFKSCDHLSIVDLGCGSGSNLRALAPDLIANQSWRLVDYDPALLVAARATLSDWADHHTNEGDALVIRKDATRIEVRFRQADLSTSVASVLDDGVDLVTATAFFDLVSPAWIEGFCADLARRRLPLFATLTYNGEETWLPPHSSDSAMLAAFHAHQAGDKGFGPAAGPAATGLMQAGLAAHGYRVAIAPSPWRLDAAHKGLIAALADGASGAVAETGRVEAAVIDDWSASRRQAQSCEIGHADLFGVPNSD